MMQRCISGMALVMLGAAALAGTPAVPSPPGHQVGEEAALLAAMDRYIAAISASDLGAKG